MHKNIQIQPEHLLQDYHSSSLTITMICVTFSFYSFVYCRLNAITPFLTLTRFLQFAGAYMDSIHQDWISPQFPRLSHKCTCHGRQLKGEFMCTFLYSYKDHVCTSGSTYSHVNSCLKICVSARNKIFRYNQHIPSGNLIILDVIGILPATIFPHTKMRVAMSSKFSWYLSTRVRILSSIN